jgi:peptidoglycan/LPS O-acetylase OafA/YrhL
MVALTPMAGALAFPLVVPLVLKHAGIPAAVLSAVAIAVIWFVLMLRTAEMPGHS